MGIYHTHFTWPLLPTAASVERFVSAYSASLGLPCRIDSLRATVTGVDASVSYPGVSRRGDYFALFGARGIMEWPPIAFFWGHATLSVRQLGGVFGCRLVCDNPAWTSRKWRELKWSERARLRLGFGFDVI